MDREVQKDRNILVTGGSGFVGHWLRETFPFGKGTGFTLLDSERYEKENWQWFDWDYIIHAAPIAPTEVLKIAKRDNARLLYVSSGIIYHPENNNEYRQNKLKWEKECYNSGVDVVVARLFAFYGEKLDDKKAYTQFKMAAEKGKPLRIWGDGKAIRSYMHGSEMARWMWAILLHGESGEAYDVGDDMPVTMLELAEDIKKRYGNFSPEIIIENRIPDPVPVYLPPDTAKTKRLLEKM